MKHHKGITRKLLLVVGSAAALAAVMTIPAGAVGTSASFTLTAGALSISAPAGPVSLGTQAVSNAQSTISGTLGVVTVSDLRGGVTTWTASVISTAFTPTAGPADPASNISYTAGTITQANVVATAVPETDLTGVSTVMTGSSASNSTASWNPTITIIVPANEAAGVYTATITDSVA